MSAPAARTHSAAEEMSDFGHPQTEGIRKFSDSACFCGQHFIF
jgi:hypothetical protein